MIFRTVLVLLLALALLLWLLQGRMMYFPRGYYGRDLAAQLERLTWQADGAAQFAYLLPPNAGAEASNAPIWVVFGGNGSRALDWVDHFREPGRKSWIVLFDYPGYGRNEGSMSIASARRSLEGFLPALAARFGSLEGRLHAAGHSLGAAVALEFARRQPVRELILLSPFTSMFDMARRQVGWPLCYVLSERWDNRANLAAILQAPAKPERVRIFHGAEDTLIPPSMGQELATTHQLPFLLIEKAGHNEATSSLRIE